MQGSNENDMTKITDMSLLALADALENRSISAKEIVTEYIDRIIKTDKQINAFITFTPELALAEADKADNRRSKGEHFSRYDGIPFALKDNICTAGIKTTCASKMLSDFVPQYDATAYKLLKEKGFITLGKLNMDEFGMGSTTENSAFFNTRNPLDISLTPGGSSGGPAAAVCARQVPFSLATDTGGSIRQPAAFCGMVGMKPTYGAVSRFGLIAFASSFDQIGPITQNVRDNAEIFNLIAKKDALDFTSVGTKSTDASLSKTLTVGVPEELLWNDISNEVTVGILNAAELFRSLGFNVVNVSLKNLKSALSAYYIISSAEASSNLARYDGIRYGYRPKENITDIDELYIRSRTEGFGDEVKRRILLGSYVLSKGYQNEYYKKAHEAMRIIKNDFDEVFEKADILLCPCAPTVAYPLGKNTSPIEMYMSDIFTVPANLAGLPALSLPCGISECGLPIGMQLIGPRFSENTLYFAAEKFESASGIVIDIFENDCRIFSEKEEKGV